MSKRDFLIKRDYTVEARKTITESTLWENTIAPFNKEKAQFLPFVENKFATKTKDTYYLLKKHLYSFVKARQAILAETSSEEQGNEKIKENSHWLHLLENARPVSDIQFDNGFFEETEIFFGKIAFLQSAINTYKTPIDETLKKVSSCHVEDRNTHITAFFEDTTFLEHLKSDLILFEELFMQPTETRFNDFHALPRNAKKAEFFEEWKYDCFVYISQNLKTELKAYTFNPDKTTLDMGNGATLTEIQIMPKPGPSELKANSYNESIKGIRLASGYKFAHSTRETFISSVNSNEETMKNMNIEELFKEKTTIDRYTHIMDLKSKLSEAQNISPETQHLVETIFDSQLPESLNMIQSVSYMKDDKKAEIEGMFLKMLEKSITKLEAAIDAHESEVLETMNTYFTANENVIEGL